MEYDRNKIEIALKTLSKNYPDIKVNNNKSISLMSINNQHFQRISMKRSQIKHTNYQQCIFKNVAMNGSSIHKSFFHNCQFIGSNFANSNFFKCEFSSNNGVVYKDSNFSQINFTKCTFSNILFLSSSFLQTLYHQCKFNNVHFKSSTMESCQFLHCDFSNIDAGNANVEYIELLNSTVKNAIFPFYQFAYVIGAADIIKDPFSDIILRAGKKQVKISEYRDNIENLICYYYVKNEYFAICNLYISVNEEILAKQALLDGINLSLRDFNFRMIRHYCKLAKHHNLLDENIINNITCTLDTFLMQEYISVEQLNDCMIHIGEIKRLLLKGNKNNISYILNIKTNIDKENERGIYYVNSLCNELNMALSQNKFDHSGFQVTISNHSPYEIIVEVIGNVANIATIAALIWQIIDKHSNNSNSKIYLKNYDIVDKEVYQKYITTRIDLCKERLLNIKNLYSKKKMNDYIEEITQELKTDMLEFYDRDILIFIKKNN